MSWARFDTSAHRLSRGLCGWTHNPKNAACAIRGMTHLADGAQATADARGRVKRSNRPLSGRVGHALDRADHIVYVDQIRPILSGECRLDRAANEGR